MTSFLIVDDLPFVSVTLRAHGEALTLQHVLLDTRSAATVFKTDDLAKLGIAPDMHDRIVYMIGVGGEEAVIEKQIASLEVGDLVASPVTVQMGAVEYGIAMDGILGNDFLLQVGARIDFNTLTIGRSQ